MLPKLVVLRSEKSLRGTLTFVFCALALLGLPTFYGVAQSQEAEPSVENKAADEPLHPAVKETTEGAPTEQPPPRDPDEPSIAELVAQFNELVKAQQYGQAKLIAKMVKNIDPRDPVGEIMMWKVQYRLGEIKTYSSGASDGKAFRSKTPAVTNVRRPNVVTTGTTDDAQQEAQRAFQRLKILEKSAKNLPGHDATTSQGVQGPAELPESESVLTKLSMTPEMARIVEHYNVALKEKRYDAADELARAAKKLEPGNPTTEIMYWKAKFARNVNAPSAEFLPSPSAETQRIVLALEEKTSFHFEEVPLTEALKKIAQHHKINIVIDPSFFSADKAEENTRITLKVDGISLKNALKLMLALPQLSYAVENEVLRILPQDAAARRTITLIYPVQDLVGESKDFDSLVSAIQSSVGRGTWSQGGADVSRIIGTISTVPASGSLVILHNWQIHSEVLDLLRTLRQAKSIQATTPSSSPNRRKPPAEY